MKSVILKNTTPEGDTLEATFVPEKGMNMISYKKNDCEVMAQGTSKLFEERCAGLGALIGPHFHHRNPLTIKDLENDSLFPHIAQQRKKGVKEPFSHGIARYVPWSCQADQDHLSAEVSGKDKFHDTLLSDLEGQDFTIRMDVDLQPDGLQIKMSVVSEADSLVGLHYYYHLPNGEARVESSTQNQYRSDGGPETIPNEWLAGEHALSFSLEKEADYGFYPFPDPCVGRILLTTSEYKLETLYNCVSAENSWQLYKPANEAFVCIEPMTASNPRKPQLTVSSINVKLRIL